MRFFFLTLCALTFTSFALAQTEGAPTTVAPVQTTEAQPKQPVVVYYYAPAAEDSTAIYQQHINRYNASAASFRSKGSFFLFGGIGLTTLGIVAMIAGAGDLDETCNDNGYGGTTCTAEGNGVGLFAFGYVTTLVGVAGIGTGVTLKIIGRSKSHRALREQNRLNQYQSRSQNAPLSQMELKLIPQIDLNHQRAGASLALQF
jgi:hypothetical protein